MALEETDLTIGRRFSLGGQDLDVQGVIRDSTFNSFLIVCPPDSHGAILVAQSVVLEEGDLVDPDQDAPDATGATDAPVTTQEGTEVQPTPDNQPR